MTLVVGRVSGRRVAVASDTQLTEHNARLPIPQGVVKSCMLPGGICVSFSNSPELAMKDFTNFAQTFPQGTGFANVIAFFEGASAKSGNDYLIAFAQHARLVKVADGKRVRSESKTQWIGDASAYQRFREYESRKRGRAEAGRAVNAAMFVDEIDKSPASDLYSAMRNVLADREVPSVGGFVCVISDRVDGFRHSAYCDMLFDWPATASEDFQLQLNDQIDFGASGENQGFSVSQGSTSYLNLNATAFYVLTARKLFVFASTHHDALMRCCVLSEVGPLEIVPRLNAHFGEDLGWLIQVLSAAPSATSTQFREPLIEEGPSGARFQFLCHVNTFPKSATAV